METINNIAINTSDWTEVFSACLGQSIATQTACGERIVKNSRWSINFTKGTITFGKTEYPIQFLGSESKVSNTWLWGWDNINHFKDEIITLPNTLRDLGTKWHLRPLTLKEFDLNDTYNGHNLSMVSCVLSGEKLCYYRCMHETGAAFVAFSGLPDSVFAPVDILNFSSITAQCIQKFFLNHRIFIKSFLNWNNTPFEETDDMIIGHFPQDLYVKFKTVESREYIIGISTERSKLEKDDKI